MAKRKKSRPAAPETPGAEPMTEAELHAFLSDPSTRALAIRIIARRVPPQDAADLAHEAIAESKGAARRPRKGNARAWFAQICRWRAARLLERRRFEGQFVTPLLEPRYAKDEAGYDLEDQDPIEDCDPSHDPERDRSFHADVMLLRAWVERNVTDPEKLQTFAWMCEWAEGEKTYADIAAQNGISLGALNKRVERFKLEIQEPYRRWRNNMLWLMLGGGTLLVGIVVAIVHWLLAPSAPEVRPDPAFAPVVVPKPVPTASSAPLVAQPTEPETTLPPLDAGPMKPPWPDKPPAR